MTNEDTTDFDEHFAKISSYIVDTLHGVPLEMTEDGGDSNADNFLENKLNALANGGQFSISYDITIP